MAAPSAGILPVQIAMTLGACARVVAELLTLRKAYESIDWPIIILLGAMIPLGLAMENTGGAAPLANQVLSLSSVLSPLGMLFVLLLVTMFLSDAVNHFGGRRDQGVDRRQCRRGAGRRLEHGPRAGKGSAVFSGLSS